MTNGDPLQLPDPSRLRAHVEALAAHERSNHDRHGEPLGYIDGAFGREGLQVSGHTYTYAGRVGINLVGRKQGMAGQPPLLLCAHYDSVEGSRGADDNASGVAVLLECARLLAPLPLGRTVDFVALDMEELQPEGEGLVGSRAYVWERGREHGYAGAFVLEMVGYASGLGTQKLPPGFQLLFPAIYQGLASAGFPGNGLAVVSNRASMELGRAIADAARQGGTPLAVSLLDIPDGAPLLWDLFRSDHASFWAAGIPATLLTDTADYRNPNYHTARDTPDTLDYDFMARVTAALAGALAGLAK